MCFRLAGTWIRRVEQDVTRQDQAILDSPSSTLAAAYLHSTASSRLQIVAFLEGLEALSRVESGNLVYLCDGKGWRVAAGRQPRFILARFSQFTL